jgi:hypothetical protein
MNFDFNVLQRFANIRATTSESHPSVSRRIFAFAVDLFITLFVRILILAMVKYMFKYKIIGVTYSKIFSFFITVILLSIGIAYRLFYMFRYHATIGMMLFRFKLYAMPLNYLSKWRIATRESMVSVLIILSGLIFLLVKLNHPVFAFFLVFVVFLWVEMHMATKRSQFFHDFVTNTQLIKI